MILAASFGRLSHACDAVNDGKFLNGRVLYTHTGVRKMRIYKIAAAMMALGISACSDGDDVDYKKLLREDRSGYVDSVDKEYLAKCKEARAKSPEVARESDPYCRALRMGRLCLKDGICP